MSRICLLVIMILLWQPTRAFAAIGENTAYAIILFTPGFITGAVLARHRTAEARAEKNGLLERGYSATKGDTYLVGGYLNPDLVVFGRYGREGGPYGDLEAVKGEAGVRSYLKCFYGEHILQRLCPGTFRNDFISATLE